MPTVTVYHQQCPNCGQRWSARLSEQQVIRIGRESFRCNCGAIWPTGSLEWSHLLPKQRREYFVSTAEIGVLVVCVLIPPLFAYFIANGWHSALRAFGWGFCTGLVFVAFLWLIKLAIVALSLRRCPPASPGVAGP